MGVPASRFPFVWQLNVKIHSITGGIVCQRAHTAVQLWPCLPPERYVSEYFSTRAISSK